MILLHLPMSGSEIVNNSAFAHHVNSLITSCDNDLTAAAHKMRVSVSTLARWRNGQSRPHPTHQRRLNSLINLGNPQHEDLFEKHTSSPLAPRLQKLETHILDALSEIREIFHRYSHFSSQQDCLDLIASLFFAHIGSIYQGGDGISSTLINGSKHPAQWLIDFVSDAYGRILPADQRGPLEDRFTSLSLHAHETEFAVSVARAIEKTTDAVREAHAHARDDVINAIFSRFLSGSFVDEKEMGQYLTPPEIVHLMSSYGLSCLTPAMRECLTTPEKAESAGLILDPSCGVGSFLGATAQILSEEVRAKASPSQFQDWCKFIFGRKLVGFDKSTRMAHLATTNLFLFGAGEVKIYRTNALSKTNELVNSPNGRCCLILTNPPFGASYSLEDLEGYKIAKRYGRATRPIDSELLFVERYIEWLLPGGVLVSIVPDNLLTGQGIYAYVRNYIREHCDILSIVSLPSVTFAAAGTSTKTSILAVRKKTKDVPESKRVYFGVCDSVGFDVVTRRGYRRRVPVDQNDLSTIFWELCDAAPPSLGRWAHLPLDSKRWDATYHAHASIAADAGNFFDDSIRTTSISEIADLIDDRCHPRRAFDRTFPYIEISGIDPKTGWVNAKYLPVDSPPSRARKRVKSGDVLVSTVRPERGAVGVVPKDLDGAICTTGIAVLRPRNINSHLLRRVLVSRYVLNQMERHNAGIAYPTISERDLASFLVPIQETQIEDLEGTAKAIGQVLSDFDTLVKELDDALATIGPELSR